MSRLNLVNCEFKVTHTRRWSKVREKLYLKTLTRSHTENNILKKPKQFDRPPSCRLVEF